MNEAQGIISMVWYYNICDLDSYIQKITQTETVRKKNTWNNEQYMAFKYINIQSLVIFAGLFVQKNYDNSKNIYAPDKQFGTDIGENINTKYIDFIYFL